MDIGEIGAGISQSTIEQPLDVSAVAHVAKFVDAHVIDIVSTHRDHPMTHNLRNEIGALEALARLSVKEYRAWCPVDSVRPAEMIGAEQNGRTNLRFCKAVSAGCGVIGDLAMQ